MKIKSQNNNNQGDVYNIEKIDTSNYVSHQNVSSYLVDEGFISGDSVDSCSAEGLIIFLLAIVGFFADISGLFPAFKVPWWLWILGCFCAFLYLVFKYGEVFCISKNEKIQISEPGIVLLVSGGGFSKNRSEAPCIYPNCMGKILPVNVPSEYDGPYRIMGKCSIADLQHGYVIDDNLQAYKADVYGDFEKSESGYDQRD